MPNKGKISILGIGAHAADVFGRAGGTMARYAQMGAKAAVVCASYGERGEAEDLWKQEGMTVKKVKQIKQKEAIKAADILGVELYLLDYEDNPLVFNKERFYKLIDIIREMKPDILLTHWKDDYVNWDHATTSEWTLRAAWSSSRLGVLTSHPPHKVKEIYMFMPSGLSDDISGFRPDILVDISDTLEIKKKAISCFTSQSKVMDYYTGYAPNYRGRQGGVEYAEPFVRFSRGYKSGSVKLLPCGK